MTRKCHFHLVEQVIEGRLISKYRLIIDGEILPDVCCSHVGCDDPGQIFGICATGSDD